MVWFGTVMGRNTAFIILLGETQINVPRLTFHVFRFVLRMRGQPATAGRGLHFETILDSSKFHSEQITHNLTTNINTYFTYFF